MESIESNEKNDFSPASYLKGVLKDCPPAKKLSLQKTDSYSVTEVQDREVQLSNLRGALKDLDTLMGQMRQMPTAGTKSQCILLLKHISSINLPAEIKSKEAGNFSTQLQNLVDILDKDGVQENMTDEYANQLMDPFLGLGNNQFEILTTDGLFNRMDSFGGYLDDLQKRSNQSFTDFLSGPLTPENIKKLKEETEKITGELSKETNTIVQNFVKLYPNMSEEERQKAEAEAQKNMAELKRMEEQNRHEQAEYLAKRDQYSEGSDEWKKYNIAAQQKEKLANSYADNYQLFQKSIKACKENASQKNLKTNAQSTASKNEKVITGSVAGEVSLTGHFRTGAPKKLKIEENETPSSRSSLNDASSENHTESVVSAPIRLGEESLLSAEEISFDETNIPNESVSSTNMTLANNSRQIPSTSATISSAEEISFDETNTPNEPVSYPQTNATLANNSRQIPSTSDTIDRYRQTSGNEIII